MNNKQRKNPALFTKETKEIDIVHEIMWRAEVFAQTLVDSYLIKEEWKKQILIDRLATNRETLREYVVFALKTAYNEGSGDKTL